MNTDAVVGCDAIEASTEWLRLRTTSGMVRTIPWSSIQFAGIGGNFAGSLTIGQVTEKVAPFFATHDSLWIVYGEHGLAQAMMEKDSPKRQPILDKFAQQLDDRWRGDRITVNDVQRQFTREMGANVASGMKKSLLIFAAVTVAFIAVLVWSAMKK